MLDPCHGADQCHFWPRHDDRCGHNTEPHSAMCELHADRDYLDWWESHALEDCCDGCCPGKEVHDD